MDRTRRAVLVGLATALPMTSLAAAGKRLRYVDIHHHFVAPAFDAFNARFTPGSAPLPWNLAADLADMDASATALSVLSGFTPSVGGAPQDRARLARETNEFGAALVRDHPRRFALMATLPIPDIETSLEEAAYAFDTLGAVGLAVYTDAGDKWLGDPLFAPLWSELNRRRAVVFVHPHSPPCCVNVVPGVSDTVIEYATATTRSIASLIFSGTTRRYPDIRWIFSHGGGTAPFLIERLLGGTSAQIVPGVTTVGPKIKLDQPPGSALAELRRMYFDTAQIANPVALRALKTVVGASQILYGTDVWFRTEAESVKGLTGSGVFTSRELAQVAAGNALRLLPSLAISAIQG